MGVLPVERPATATHVGSGCRSRLTCACWPRAGDPPRGTYRATGAEFAERVGLTPANVAVLKNGRAKAVRFSTLEAMCRVLECRPGDLLEWLEEVPGPGRHEM
ncbi:helix-turn-helix domain-containing protein [Micromonospora pattaloongensis]|uniref:helix-turn-helix domain-containing protein n=1 Tax=Micromonospora pattaloongensis TaxID=405436 RepID=UPI003CCC3DB1